jgi:hypothetical protein
MLAGLFRNSNDKPAQKEWRGTLAAMLLVSRAWRVRSDLSLSFARDCQNVGLTLRSAMLQDETQRILYYKIPHSVFRIGFSDVLKDASLCSLVHTVDFDRQKGLSSTQGSFLQHVHLFTRLQVALSIIVSAPAPSGPPCSAGSRPRLLELLTYTVSQPAPIQLQHYFDLSGLRSLVVKARASADFGLLADVPSSLRHLTLFLETQQDWLRVAAAAGHLIYLRRLDIFVSPPGSLVSPMAVSLVSNPLALFPNLKELQMSIQVDLVPLLAYPHARLETIVMRHHSNARDAIESPLLSKAVYQAIIPLRQSFPSLHTLLLVHRSGSPEALTAHAQARYDRLQADLRGAGLRLCIAISTK